MVVVAGHDIKRDLQAVAGVHVFKCGAEAKVVLVTLNAVRVKVVTLSQSAPPHKKLKQGKRERTNSTVDGMLSEERQLLQGKTTNNTIKKKKKQRKWWWSKTALTHQGKNKLSVNVLGNFGHAGSTGDFPRLCVRRGFLFLMVVRFAA